MRNDPVSVNHRVAALLASYFDVLFAVNELPHPGEKTILQHAQSSCLKRPADMERQVMELAASIGRPNGRTVHRVMALADGLEELLVREKLLLEDGRMCDG